MKLTGCPEKITTKKCIKKVGENVKITVNKTHLSYLILSSKVQNKASKTGSFIKFEQTGLIFQSTLIKVFCSNQSKF